MSPDLDEASERLLKRTPKGAGIVNVTVQGISQSGNWGHQGMHPYHIVADKISDVAVVLKGMKGREEEQKAERQWACGGNHPK